MITYKKIVSMIEDAVKDPLQEEEDMATNPMVSSSTPCK